MPYILLQPRMRILSQQVFCGLRYVLPKVRLGNGVGRGRLLCPRLISGREKQEEHTGNL